jgi:hypothetical protein
MFDSRFKAFAVHFLISACLVLLIVLLVFCLWYPSPLHSAVGVTKIFLVLIVVDVVLGPCLTFLVYKQGKKSLAMDLSIICALQLGALLYGLNAMAEGRPAWLVFVGDHFTLVRANEIDERKLADAPVEYRNPSWFGAQWVFVVEPEDVEEKNDLLFESVFAGIDISQRPNLYRPLSTVEGVLKKMGMPLAALERYNASESVVAIIDAYPQAEAWLPLKASQRDMVVLLKADGEVIAIVDARPWD